MDIFVLLAFAALLATIVIMVLGIRSMIHGGAEDREASTRLMFRRVEFQAAAVALVIAAVLFAGGLMRDEGPASDRVEAALGVLPAQQLRARYAPDSEEAEAYGGVAEGEYMYLVTLALNDRSSGERIDNASVTATVGPLGLSGESKQLRPAEFGGQVTYGNYFHMPKPGIYEIDVAVERPRTEGTDLLQLKYHRP